MENHAEAPEGCTCLSCMLDGEKKEKVLALLKDASAAFGPIMQNLINRANTDAGVEGAQQMGLAAGFVGVVASSFVLSLHQATGAPRELLGQLVMHEVAKRVASAVELDMATADLIVVSKDGDVSEFKPAAGRA